MTSLKAPWFQRWASNQSQAEGRQCLCSHVFIYCAVCKKEQYSLLDTPVILPFFLFWVEENQDWWDPEPPCALQLTAGLKDVDSKGIDFFGLH